MISTFLLLEPKVNLSWVRHMLVIFQHPTPNTCSNSSQTTTELKKRNLRICWRERLNQLSHPKIYLECFWFLKMRPEDVNDVTVSYFWCMLVPMIQGKSIASSVDSIFLQERSGIFSLVPLSSKLPVWHTNNAMDLKAKHIITLGMAGPIPSALGNCGWVLDHWIAQALSEHSA